MQEIPYKLSVELTYLPVINFAMQQNRVPIIRSLFIENKTTENINNLSISFSPEPDFGTIIPQAVEILPAGQNIRIDSFDLNLSANYFAQLTERLAGSFKLQISAGEEILFTKTYAIDILAYDEWGGTAVLPEMLSAFITPNHPMVVTIIKRAAIILEQWTGDASLDEYQSRTPDRVRKQMGAIYTAIAEQNIIYSTVPASFEKQGQRVRLVDSVLTQKLATCLDMALLYATCLEAIGIHPLVVVLQGHAFAGAWLIPETFSDNIVDDPSSLTKRAAEGVNDIALVETTCMSFGSKIDFDLAVDTAFGKLTKTSDFTFVLDVQRTRLSGIRPLPQRIQKGLQWEIKEEEMPTVDKSDYVPQNIHAFDLSGIDTTTVEVTKQLLWERKLLDLSLRNNLLNIRITKNTLQLISADLDRFEDALAEGDEFRILHKPSDWENPLYDFGLYQSVPTSDPVLELVKSEITQKRLHSYLTEGELAKALTHLYRSSRTAMEENGANTLYLALGLLKWYETPKSERPRYAPILLLPVEIIRKSAATGYVIRSREEDTMMNITLLEMLRQNFGITISGLDPLPTDDSGVNVRLIYSIIRNAIKNQAKWDVEEQAILGIFSFNKFIMWNDIHNNASKLKENKMVLSLINGKIEWDAVEDMADASDLDKQLLPSDIILPIGADSSQLEAIYEAVNGKSFILHGPPGTGKSQTITNIIANALYKGKRVLFVAEKMAALSVVQNRLTAIGLAPFCLELHSNKVRKSVVIDQLRASTEVMRKRTNTNFEQEAKRLFKLRMELSTYVEALHKKYSFGFSLYEAIGRNLAIEKTTEIEFPSLLIEGLGEDQIVAWQDGIDLLISTSNACEHPYKHPLTGINLTTYIPTMKDGVSKLITETIELLARIDAQKMAVKILLPDVNFDYSNAQTEKLSIVIEKLLAIPELTSTLLTRPGLTDVLDECKVVLVHGKERDSLKSNLMTDFSVGVLEVNAQFMSMQWKKDSDKWFLPRLLGQRGIKKQLKVYSHRGKISTENVEAILDKIMKYKEEASYVNRYADSTAAYFGKYGKSEEENWEAIGKIIADTEIINNELTGLAKDIADSAKIKDSIAKQLVEGITPFRQMYGKALTDFNDLFAQLNQLDVQLADSLGVDKNSFYEDSADWINIASTKLQTWLGNLHKLKDWYQWLQVCRKLDELNIGFLAEEYTNKNIPSNEIEDVFFKSFYKSCIDYILSQEQELQFFKGDIFNDTIQKFKQLSVDFESITKQELYAKLASNIPSFTREATQNSEVGILQRNIRNNARGISIRKLFDQIPTLLNRMCPCMLMSPISAAQYIDTDADKFDLIIFDEASQMSTSEAVGAIARGKSVVVVGDPKQLPPTNFFSVNNVDDENMDMEDMESILDDCLALSIPSKYLSWHYRSKHESLIAFSNSEYYDNRLLTFPSPDSIESKVQLVSIDGFYDKGKSRQNKAEAEAVINEIVRRLSDDELRQRSIGVVTFSSVQQTLIEDMLSDVFLMRPDLERLALECSEPIFIKNLENVQGDERDIILFSIGYGPDADGKVSMNFGPLNRQGGERRLNVAVSRARYEMLIYSTLHASDIDLNRTSSIGVAGLKRFLEYAERGEKLYAKTSMASATSIEKDITEKLNKLGYEVHTNIGYSGYKIDICIVDKKNPSMYILGILCDGENYKQTKTVRDREIVQNSVLKLLGWNIYRVWTMDWWENSEKVLHSIQNLLADLEDGKMIEEEGIPIADKDTNMEQEDLNMEYDNMLDEDQKKYKRATFKAVGVSQYDSFFMPTNKPQVVSQIKKVLEVEAPISKDLLCRSVLSAWGITRLGQRVDDYLDELFTQENFYRTVNDDITFFWANEEQYNDYSTFRPDSDRTPFDLPAEEIANGIKHILDAEMSLPTKDLMRVTAQLFNFSRSGANVEAAVHRGVLEAVRKGYIRVDGERAIVS